jgi:RNA polymerase sigma factor (sigma-70 family)
MTTSRDVLGEGSVPQFTETAFETFHGQTFPMVWTIARRLCRDETEAHDVAQIAYLGVYRYWKEGKLLEPPRRLLFRIAQRAAVDALRGRARRQRLFAALPKDSNVDWVEGELKDALRALRPEDAALVMAQAAGGYSYAELAAINHRSVGAIRSRLHRARAQLRRTLYGDAP